MSNPARAYSYAPALALLAALGLGCDPTAEARDGMGPRASAELESCAAANQCAAGLRCVDGACAPEKASALGDYYAALGRLALQRSELNTAIDVYSRAVNQYESDGVAAPAWLYCEQGHALVSDRNNPERAEIGARVLHRCLLRTPPGSELRRRALSDLALLDEQGLEPLTLARDEPADAYLTRAPSAPPGDDLELTMEGSGTKSRTFTGFVSHLESQDLVDDLTPCWEAHWKASHEDELSLTVPFRYTFRLTRYDDFDRAVISIPDESPPSGDGMDEAYECAVEVLKPLANEYSKKQYAEVRWRAEVEFNIGSGG